MKRNFYLLLLISIMILFTVPYAFAQAPWSIEAKVTDVNGNIIISSNNVPLLGFDLATTGTPPGNYFFSMRICNALGCGPWTPSPPLTITVTPGIDPVCLPQSQPDCE